MKASARWLVLGALLSCSPALAQDASTYDRAVAARLAGEPAEASRLLHGWLQDHPDDLDARLQLALAQLALGKLDEAEEGFTTVLARAPDYADARTGLASVAARRAEGTSRSTELSFDTGLGLLDGPGSDWADAGARLTTALDPRMQVNLGATYYRRFGLEDVELDAGVVTRVGDDLWLRAQGGVTPGADFRPEWQLGGGFDWRLSQSGEATVLSADIRHQEFPAQGVTTFSPGITQYLAGGRAWLTVRASGLVASGDHLRVGLLARGDYEPSEGYRLFVGMADGPDTELGVVSQVTSVFGGAELPLSEAFTLSVSAAREWRDVGADRTDLRIGFKFRL